MKISEGKNVINFAITSTLLALFLIPYSAESADTQPINYETAYKLVEDKIEL
jgi:hypothetical protein